MFVDFLTAEGPFATVFDTAVAEDFYKNVRCGLLHEARTKGGWTIWGTIGANTPIDAKERVLYRDDMQDAIHAYVARFRIGVTKDAKDRDAFIKTFDSLAKP